MEKDMLGKRLGFEIYLLHNLIKRNVENLEYIRRIEKMTGTNSRIISYLAHHQEKDIFQKDIQMRFSVTRSTVSTVLSLMEEKGMIRRESVDYDARLKKICLTDKAIQMHKAIEQELDALDQRMVEGFSEKEKAEFFQYIQRVKDNIGD